MKNQIARITLFRHGESDCEEYKTDGKRPDLTKKGISAINAIADDLYYTSHQESYNFISSPAFRAIDSIKIIQSKLDQNKNIIIDNLLRPPELKRGAWTVINENAEYSDIQYTRDPIYNDSSLFEPRKEIKKRFFTFLSNIFQEGLREPDNTHKIVCAHYEILYHFAQKIFSLNYNRGDKTLGYGETINIWAYKKSTPYLVYMDIYFRDLRAFQIPYDYTKNRLIFQ